MQSLRLPNGAQNRFFDRNHRIKITVSCHNRGRHPGSYESSVKTKLRVSCVFFFKILPKNYRNYNIRNFFLIFISSSVVANDPKNSANSSMVFSASNMQNRSLEHATYIECRSIHHNGYTRVARCIFFSFF